MPRLRLRLPLLAGLGGVILIGIVAGSTCSSYFASRETTNGHISPAVAQGIRPATADTPAPTATPIPYTTTDPPTAQPAPTPTPQGRLAGRQFLVPPTLQDLFRHKRPHGG
jgi:hypothetical protein